MKKVFLSVLLVLLSFYSSSVDAEEEVFPRLKKIQVDKDFTTICLIYRNEPGRESYWPKTRTPYELYKYVVRIDKYLTPYTGLNRFIGSEFKDIELSQPRELSILNVANQEAQNKPPSPSSMKEGETTVYQLDRGIKEPSELLFQEDSGYPKVKEPLEEGYLVNNTTTIKAYCP